MRDEGREMFADETMEDAVLRSSRVVEASGLDTYAELDGAYLAGEEQAVAPTIPAVDFALIGDDLSTPQKRTLIVAAAASGVRSYQAFEITFHAAP